MGVYICYTCSGDDKSCIVDNGEINHEQARKRFQVDAEPVVKVSKMKEDTYVTEGSDVILECKLESSKLVIRNEIFMIANINVVIF